MPPKQARTTTKIIPLFEPGRPMTRAYSRELGLAGGNPEASGDATRASNGAWAVRGDSGSFSNGMGGGPRIGSVPRNSSQGRASTPTTKSASSSGGGGGGLLKCSCAGFILTPTDQILECTKCRNWSHALCCVPFDRRLADGITKEIRAEFVCFYCSDGTGRQKRDRGGRAPTAAPKLEEVPDRPPSTSELAHLDLLLSRIQTWAKQKGYTLMCWPEKGQRPMSEKQMDQLLDCCKTSITDATFSEAYPQYCFKEQRQAQQQQITGSKAAKEATSAAVAKQSGDKSSASPALTTSTGANSKYLQMAAFKDIAADALVSCVLSNGMDIYGNLKSTVAGLKSAMSRDARRPGGKQGEQQNAEDLQGWKELTDFSDFVHYTLVVTSDDHRGKGLAKMLMIVETIRWLKRGRTRAYVNMALTKTLGEKDQVLCGIHPASRQLYESCGFMEVHPKYEPGSTPLPQGGGARAGEQQAKTANGTIIVVERFTKKEADAGRLMGVLDAKAGMLKALSTGFPTISTADSKGKRAKS